MPVFLDVPPSCQRVADAVEQGLARVVHRFDQQLASDLPAVAGLVRHIERYRGKMLRPILCLVTHQACGGATGFNEEAIVCAAVCEMVHMATLVHDDVLDEADTRRAGQTVNRLHGNEAAVMLGDLLIASAYHLCSQLADQSVALRVGSTAMTLCAGELLQLSHRENFSLDEPTYFEIIDRKTASLIGLASRLGAQSARASAATCDTLDTFGRKLGLAFQIQDDLLDLTGRQAALGKPVGQDLAKGKLTLPLIHHLASVTPARRGQSLEQLERAITGDAAAARDLTHAAEASGSITHARRAAHKCVADAKALLAGLPKSPAQDMLLVMADAVINRST